jgi:TonB family protein
MAEVLAPLMPEATDKRESERAVVGMALPNPKIESAQPEGKASDAGEELLPEPIVPSSRMAAWVEPLRGRGTKETNRPKSAEPGKSRSVGLGMLLILAMAGGAWYGNWWQYLPVGRKPLEAGAVKVGTPSSPRSTQTPNAKAAVPTATVNQSSGPKELNAATSAAAAEAKSRAREALGTGNEGNRDVERTRETSSREVLANRAGENPSGTKERVVGKTALKQANAGNKGSEPSAKEIVASDAPVIPARLLKAVNPVYPPDAMRKYITGDVKAEVLVEPSGRVRDVTVIAGPQALRAAAVEALKQYEFAHATQGGKAVASKTTEVVKFWFNP